jgi:hypothetical protein
MEDNHRFVDELLDSALAQYRSAEPCAGLEGRILERVRATASERSTGRIARRFWAAAAATAAVLALVAIYASNRAHKSVPQTPQVANTAPIPSPAEALKASSEPTPAAGAATKVAEPMRAARSERKPLRHIEEHHWPSQFPTPAPLTPEQRALVQYVRETPRHVLTAPIMKADFTVHRVEIKPLKIAPVEIQPLSARSTEEEVQ